MRTARRLFVIANLFLAIPNLGCADLVVFHNGDYVFGKATVNDASKEVLVESGGIVRRYDKSQVKYVLPEITRPAPGVVLRATEGFVYSATDYVPDITAPITTRKTLPSGNKDKKVLTLDVEQGFDVSSIHLLAANYGFYNRPGCYLSMAFENVQTRNYRGVEFRATFYGDKDMLLASKDFYLWKMPGSQEKNVIKKAVVNLAVPDIPYELVSRIRVVRKF
ncbi:MAG: hypothetical protein AB1656_00500 [Candidatus Omnitrophota bacterium]